MQQWNEGGDTLAKQAINKMNDSLSYLYKNTAMVGMRFFSSIGIWYLLVQKLIAPYMLHDTFVIVWWGDITLFYLLILITWGLIYLFTWVVTKLLMYVFH